MEDGSLHENVKIVFKKMCRNKDFFKDSLEPIVQDLSIAVSLCII